MATAASTSGRTDASGATPDEAYRWFLAWAVVVLVIALINRTRLGHVIVYYVLALMLAFLVVTQAHWFAAALLPISNPQAADEQARANARNGLNAAGALAGATLGQQVGQPTPGSAFTIAGQIAGGDLG